MKIKLLSLALTNFKRIRSQQFTFDEKVTNIYGDNEVGKTTLFDAFLWLLFGKDSTDRKEFEIKTLDKNNQPFRKLDHEVEGVFLVDDQTIKLRRCFREKWQKPKAALEAVFKGHEQKFFWNDVPMQKAEFEAEISKLLNEGMFKLITNTNYFNAQKWQDRRAILLQIAGVINDVDVLDSITTLQNKTQIGMITNALNQRKTIEQYRREIVTKKNNLKSELDLIPTRIAEATRAMPDPLDYDALQANLETVLIDIQNIDGLLNNKSKAAQDHQNTINNLITQRQDLNRLMLGIEGDLRTELSMKANERTRAIMTEKSVLQNKQNERNICLNDYNTASSRKSALEQEQQRKRAEWETINAESLNFKDGEFCCPACKREFEAADVESKKLELTNNFNLSKSTRLKAAYDRGVELATEINDLNVKLTNLLAKGTGLKTEIETITARINELEEQHTRLSNDEAGQLAKAIAEHAIYQGYQNDVNSINVKIAEPYTGEDNTALTFRKNQLNLQLADLNKQLATKETRTTQQRRINELQEQESNMSQELADLEGVEFTIKQFEKAQMNILENRINGRFSVVKFKLFETQVDGQEIPVCITLINGVPYSDTNTAGKVQAGLDIINTLSDHYNVKAPVWVDNRESVVTLPPTECQLINLIVSEQDKELRIVRQNQLSSVA